MPAILRSLLEAHVKDAGNFQEGARRTREQFKNLIESKKLSPQEVSIKDLYETFVAQMYPGEDLYNAKSERISEAMASSEFPFATGVLISSTAIPAYNYEVAAVMGMVTEYTSKQRKEDIVGFGAVDRAEVVGEGEVYPETRFNEKHVRIPNQKVGEQIGVTREAIVFDQTGEVLVRAQKLGMKFGQQVHELIVTRTVSAASTLTGQAVNTSLNYGGSNYNLFQDSHSAIDGQTNDNNIATGGAGTTSGKLSTQGLTNMLTLLTTMVDNKGDYIVVSPKILLVPPQLATTAWQLTSGQTQPDTADRGDNYFRGMFKVVVSPFLSGSPTTWYLGDPAQQMRFQWVWKPEITVLGASSEDAFNRDVVFKAKLSAYLGCGATDYRFVGKAVE